MLRVVLGNGIEGRGLLYVGPGHEKLGGGISKYDNESITVKCDSSLTIPVTARFSRTVLDGVKKLDANSLNNPENGYRVSFPGVKRTGCGLDHPPPYSAEFKKE